MTQEQLAGYIVSVFDDYETRGLIAAPSEQNVTEYEKKEVGSL